ncbi:MAG: thiol reductase thioredoxin [Desulfuromonadales bacterium GWD2_61_12]|nr:MAG: thiol reductase thioredoxin [Desulfuromonadales bacterium GWC2_61_20]OGR36778.1 MAG: thiol reductase thioredoxin [Desulfuromonadales bacterium GWD2_61_12]
MRALIIAAAFLLFAATVQAELPSANAVIIKQALASGQPTVIDLGARSCIPCKKMAPILEELSATYRGKANVLFIDVREDQAAARSFGIQMIPTQIFFDGKGQEVKRHVGFMDRPDLIDGLKAAGLK